MHFQFCLGCRESRSNFLKRLSLVTTDHRLARFLAHVRRPCCPSLCPKEPLHLGRKFRRGYAHFLYNEPPANTCEKWMRRRGRHGNDESSMDVLFPWASNPAGSTAANGGMLFVLCTDDIVRGRIKPMSETPDY